MASTNREVIALHIGQAGVQLGQSCLELLALEHGLDKEGIPLLGRKAVMPNGFYSFFEEGASGKYVPRSIFVDLDPTVIDDLKAGEFGNMVSPHSLVRGKEDAASNFARGRYTIGKDILDTTLDVFRRLVEKCGSLQGFVLLHSIGGGCGSGFTTLLLDHILSDFGMKKNILDFCVFPSEASLCVVEPYNAVLSAPSLIENTNVTFPYDNQTVGTCLFEFYSVIYCQFEDLFLLSYTHSHRHTYPHRHTHPHARTHTHKSSTSAVHI